MYCLGGILPLLLLLCILTDPLTPTGSQALGYGSIAPFYSYLIVHLSELTALFWTTTSKLARSEKWGCLEPVIRGHYRKKVFGFVPFYPLSLSSLSHVKRRGLTGLEIAAKGVSELSEGQSSDTPQLKSTNQSNIYHGWTFFWCNGSSVRALHWFGTGRTTSTISGILYYTTNRSSHETGPYG